jgi:ATP-dependent helicase/DNAse subunit B
MDFLKTLDNNSILLVPNNIKNKILKYINDNKLLINIKLMTFRDLKVGLLYDYKSDAIYHVMKSESVSYETAKDFINNTYYLNEESYKGNKLNKILNIKNDLKVNELLIEDPLFINLLKSKSKMYIYGFTSINKLQDYLLELVSKHIDVISLNPEFNSYKHEAIKLPTLEDEVIYVAEKISELINQGISLNKIYLANYNQEYYFSIKKIFGLYKIPVYLKGDMKLSDTTIGKYFLDNLSDNMDKLLYKIRIKYDTDNNTYNSKIYNKLSNLINTYYWTDSYIEIKDLIAAELKTISISNDHFENEIVTTDILDNIFFDDEYVFLLGFNQKSIPKSYRDEEYIEDAIKPSLMETTLDKNTSSKLRYSIAVKNIKNLCITLKDVSISSTYLPSTLIDGENIVLKEETIKYSNFCDDLNKLLFGDKLDGLIKFNETSEELSILHKSYDIPYKEYSNAFDKLNQDKVKEKLSAKGYSYSTISTYYKCPFRFYLDYFYRLEEFETTFSTFIGSAFHKVMEECITDETKDIDDVYYQYINENKKNLPYTKKEEFYVDKVKDELHFIINTIREQYKHSEHDIKDEWHEKYIEKSTDELGLNTNIKSIIKGVVDKCIFINNDVIIIDYKTGTSATINRKYFEYGIDIQLPIYLYLLKNDNSNTNIVGMYLQHILKGLVYRNKTNKNKTYEEIKSGDLKLDGLSLDDESKLREFDDSYDKSEIISGLSKKNDGEWRYPGRMISYEEEDELYKVIENLITECINNTSDGNFKINPFKDRYHNGCDYCKYRDICFRKDSDIRNVTIVDNNTEEGDTDE